MTRKNILTAIYFGCILQNQYCFFYLLNNDILFNFMKKKYEVFLVISVFLIIAGNCYAEKKFSSISPASVHCCQSQETKPISKPLGARADRQNYIILSQSGTFLFLTFVITLSKSETISRLSLPE